MTKTFTDDDGNKYEAIEIRTGNNLEVTLKPVKVEEKQERVYEYYLSFSDDNGDNLLDEKFGQTLHFHFTKPQATALAEAVQALVEWTQQSTLGAWLTSGENVELAKKFDAARKAIQASKEGK